MRINILGHLDAVGKYGPFTYDELVIFVVFLILGGIKDNLAAFIFIGLFFVFILYRPIKNKLGGDKKIPTFKYWTFPRIFRKSKLPDSGDRHYIG